MAIQELFLIDPDRGGRDAIIAALVEGKAIAEDLGVTQRLASVTYGPNSGRIVATRTFSDWNEYATFSEGDTGRHHPLRATLNSENPPGRLVTRFLRNEQLPRDSEPDDQPGFVSALLFDAAGERASAIAALGETRDIFETLGSRSRIWAVANGPNAGRLTLTSEFESVADWAGFRGRLEQRTFDSGQLPIATAENLVTRGIAQTTAINP